MNFLSLKYWFNLNAGTLHEPIETLLIIFIIISFGLIFIFKHFKETKHKNLARSFWASLARYSTNNTVIGFILLFFTFERVLLLSARFWFLIWLAYIIWYPLHKYKQIAFNESKREMSKRNEEFQKYIPQKKKK